MSEDIRGELPVPRWVLGTAVAGTVGIALGAFWLSFTSLTSLTVLAGVSRSDAWIWPLIVDGIIVVATISVVALSPLGRRATTYPWVLLIAGAAVSVAANTVHALVAADAAVPKALAACVWAVPPIVLLAVTHLTVVLTRRARPPRVAAIPAAAIVPNKHSSAFEPSAEKTEPSTELAHAGMPLRNRAVQLRGIGWNNRMIAEELDVHPSTVGRWLVGSADGLLPAPDQHGAEA